MKKQVAVVTGAASGIGHAIALRLARDYSLVNIDINAENLKNVEKASSVLNLPEIIFYGDGKDVYIQTSDIKNPTGDVYSIKLSETDKQFKVYLKVDNLKMVPGDYTVSISSKKISRFKGAGDLVYYVAVEADSVFSN